ncbi:hypothetical protein INS49_009491 [Diaporthe citri]|uniref:uncharacterized protein n=1 Tax=Diaporthe citri TaxID=83186 RepID=UPI001C82321E|nr:uncharacterized protein INS49_009491 [Diaporthe citri]KAG6361266.1 hypothetical protein INS49_009491 [Diaporthe citri]
MATAVLAALNIQGYFVGAGYLGKVDSLSQSFYSLLLQVTAKLFWFTDWSGGGATFHIIGDNSTIWPDELRNGELCGRAQSQDGPLALVGLINDTCATSSTAAITQALQGWTFGDAYFPIEVSDGLVRRKITINLNGTDRPDTWAITPQLAPCVVSRVLSVDWRFKAIFSRMTDSIFSGYAKYRYRKRDATVAVMKSQIPVVRVSCSMSDSVEPLDPIPLYRNQPLIGRPSTDAVIVAPSPAINFKLYSNISSIATRWAEVSFNESMIAISDDGGGNRLSSAYLNVQLPKTETTSEQLAACSVDARWIEGNIMGSEMAEWLGSEYYNASVSAHGLVWPENAYEFPANNYTHWRDVRLGPEWLDALMPILDNTREGYTTFSSMLEALGVDNNASRGLGLGLAQQVIEAAIAAIVADGMAHSGYSENGSEAGTLEDARTLFQVPQGDENMISLLAGTLEVPAPGSGGSSSVQSTTMRWDLLLTGLAYSANGVGYYLALTVVFVHVLLALVHTAYSLWLRRTSAAWESFCDSFALALGSTPSRELPATSVGVTDPLCLAKRLMVRETDSNGDTGSTTGKRLQIIVRGVNGEATKLPEPQADTRY